MPTPRKWKNEAERKRAYRKKKRDQESAAERERAAAYAAPASDAVPDDTPISPVLAAVLSTANPNRDVLVAIRDDSRALASDRIRAVTEIEKIDFAARVDTTDYSPILAWRDVFAALPVGDRLKAWKAALERARVADGAIVLDADDFVYEEGES